MNQKEAMTPSATPSRSLADRLMPREVTGYTRRIAVAALISQMLIVLTGGLVRLTASGLGCSTWPKCTPDSLTATPELGIHSFIEFGNRLLTFVLLAVAILAVLAVWRTGQKRLRMLALSLLLFIPFQAIVGMITVLTHLNPWVVSVHFLISMPLIMWATQFVNAVYGTVAHRTSRANKLLALAAGVLTAAVLVVGTMVTGSGPHAGDHGASRNGLDPQMITPVHSGIVYLLVIVIVVLGLRLRSESARAAGVTWLALAVVLFQGVIGYIQHFLSLPIAVVAIHMLGTTMVVAAITHLNANVKAE
jgi:cytochrome c oxidase assembly protein subunit 15